jgi:uncharacterized protein
MAPPTTTTTPTIRDRVDALDWGALRDQLDDQGFAITGPLLTGGECEEVSALFEDGRFRSTIEMARHRFGEGRYRYFDHPLPERIAALRTAFYRHLAPVANDWSQLLRGDNPTFPLEHDELLERCRAAGQERPTPLILRYGEGDWNALHQDLYGDACTSRSRSSPSCPSPAWTSTAASSCSWSSARARRAARTCSPRRAARS